ncbi:hypothetical protein FRB99_001680 [Tulasnella sp. 403]|nr:hypothetical protein FRB99_001680 [Tulasnella sp. 403]
MTSQEEIFLSKARKGISQCLAGSDRLFQGLQASILLSDAYRASFAAVDTALTRFVQNTPSIRPGGPDTAVNYGVFILSTLAQAAVMQLHLTFAEADASAYEKCVRAAKACVGLLDQVSGTSWAPSDMMLGHCWAVVASFLVQQLAWYRSNNRQREAAETEREVTKVLVALNLLVETFPMLAFQVKKIQDLRVSLAV